MRTCSRNFWISGLVLSLSFACAGESQFAFVENGKTCCAVVAPEGVARKHLEFFTNAVFRCTGARVPIVGAARGDASSTVQGRVEFVVEKRPIERDDAYEATFPDAQTLRITCSSLSARWALNRILEDAFGVCFCLPGEIGTHYPQRRTVTLPRKGWTDAPSFPFCRQAISGRMEPEWKLSLNDRFAGDRVPVASHQLRDVFKDLKFKKPEWVAKLMPQIKGVRKYPSNLARCWEPCFACEEGVDEAVRYIAEDLRRHPHWKTYSLGVNDVGGFCECDGCKAMNGGSITNRCHFDKAYVNYSDAYCRWCNKIAAKLEKEFPDVKIGFEGYRELIDPPTFRLHKNLIPYFTVETLQAASPHVWARREELFAAWSKVCESFGLSDYNYGNFYILPRVYNGLFRKMLHFQKTYPQFKGYMAECGDPWIEGPKYWLMHKLLWNIDLDVDRALDTWYRACGGAAAAPHLKRYFDLWEEFWMGERLHGHRWWTSGVNSIYFNFFNDSYVYALEPDRLAAMEKALSEALAAAERSGTADQKARMREFDVWQRHAIAVAYASGVGATDAGNLKAEADFTKFRENFSRMQKAQLEEVETHDLITSFVRRDVGDYVDNPVWRPQLGLKFREIERGRRIDNRVRVINRYLAHDNSAAEPEGENFVPADVELKGVNARVEKDVSPGGTPRWKVTATASRDVAVSFVQKPHPTAYELFFTARVENPTGRKVSVRTCFDSWRTDTDQINGAAECGSLSVAVPPRTTQDVSILASVYKSFWLFPDIKFTLRPDLKEGESIFVDSLAIRLPSKRCLKFER